MAATIQMSAIYAFPTYRVGQVGLTEQEPVFVEQGGGTLANTTTTSYIPTKLTTVHSVHLTGTNAGAATFLAGSYVSPLSGGGFSTSLRKNFAQASGSSANTITLDSSASATNDVYNGLYIKIWQSDGDIVWAKISDYVGSTKVASLTKVDGSSISLGEVPTATTQFEILAVTITGADPGAGTGTITWKLEGLQ